MKICGLLKTTLLDYPSLVACTVFTGGCNMRCLYCHNSSLVLRAGEAGEVSADDFFSFLRKRRGVLGGVCISGGEPTLSPDLDRFMFRIRELEPQLKIKLDTNGLRPGVIRHLHDEGLLDMVAMDIKSYPEDYPRITGIDPSDVAGILESVELIRSFGSCPDYEFRTTVPAGIFDRAGFEKIGRWLEGSRAYYLQPFRDSGDCLTPGLSEPSVQELESLLSAVRPFIPAAKLRGAG